MRIRKNIHVNGEDIGVYRFSDISTNRKTNSLLKRYKNLVGILVETKAKKEWKRSEYTTDVSAIISEIEGIKQELARIQWMSGEKLTEKNILRDSPDVWDQDIGHGKDSLVFDTKRKWYVNKEAVKGGVKNYLYLKYKYQLLRRYLGDVVPKSYFVIWESRELFEKEIPRDKKMRGYKKIKTKVLTLQKKVNGKDLSKMSGAQRTNESLLTELKKQHTKYILLKIFLAQILEEMSLWKDSFDVQLEIWPLSNTETFPSWDMDTISKSLNSPNIMWDWKKVSFIDFWTWSWSQNHKKVWDRMMSPEVLARWETLLKAYGMS